MRLHRLTLTALGAFAAGRAVGARWGDRPCGDHAAVVLGSAVGGGRPASARRRVRPGTGPDAAERGVLRDAFDAVRSDAVRAETD
ncbi:hypothetical protein PV410_15575 [Streptomyces sp. PA03-5A]|nr:hypothetical protein [Streptomyces sp. PA03-5A]